MRYLDFNKSYMYCLFCLLTFDQLSPIVIFLIYQNKIESRLCFSVEVETSYVPILHTFISINEKEKTCFQFFRLTYVIILWRVDFLSTEIPSYLAFRYILKHVHKYNFCKDFLDFLLTLCIFHEHRQNKNRALHGYNGFK